MVKLLEDIITYQSHISKVGETSIASCGAKKLSDTLAHLAPHFSTQIMRKMLPVLGGHDMKRKCIVNKAYGDPLLHFGHDLSSPVLSQVQEEERLMFFAPLRR